MKKKWVILCIFGLGSLSLCYLMFTQFNRWKHTALSEVCTREPYFVSVPITLPSDQIPCLEVMIADRTIIARIDSGSGSDIKLPNEFLKAIDQKSFIKRVSYYGIRGKKYESDMYEIPKLKIGKMTFYGAKAGAINPEFEKDTVFFRDENKPSIDNLGRIGWRLFFNTNLFFDKDNSKIAFCDSLDSLKKQGYPVDSFIETKLLLDRNLIEFEAMTEKGPLRCVLDTGSTLNMLNKDLENQSNDHMIFNPDTIDQHSVLNPENSDRMHVECNDEYDMTVFKIGKKDFGPMTYQKIKVPYEFDAIIGMEFFTSKLVFIDFPNGKIYFYQK